MPRDYDHLADEGLVPDWLIPVDQPGVVPTDLEHAIKDAATAVTKRQGWRHGPVREPNRAALLVIDIPDPVILFERPTLGDALLRIGAFGRDTEMSVAVAVSVLNRVPGQLRDLAEIIWCE
jgi:hypothetical protein